MIIYVFFLLGSASKFNFCPILSLSKQTDVVRERSEVILDWMRVAETILDEHTDLRRLLFTNMVSKSIPDESLSDTILMAVKNDAKEDSSTNSPTEIFGAFE